MEPRLRSPLLSAERAKLVSALHLPFALCHAGIEKRPVFLLVHGLGESPHGMKQLADFFYRQGNHVVVVLLDGHGTQPEDLNGVSLEGWRKNVGDGLALAQSLGNEVVLCGFSLGASLTLELYLNCPNSFAGMFFYSPVFKPSIKFNQFLKEKLCEWGTKNEFKAGPSPRDNFCYPYIPANAWKQYAKLCESICHSIKPVDMPPPVTIVVSQHDWLIDWAFLDHFSLLYCGDTYLHPVELQMGHSDPLRCLGQFKEVQMMLYQNFIRRLRFSGIGEIIDSKSLDNKWK